MNKTRPTWGVRQLVEALFRHKKKIVAVSLLSLATGALALYCFPRKYRSEAKVYLQVGRESLGIDPVATTGQTISLQQSGREDEVKSAIDVAMSRGVIAKTVARLGADVVLGETAAGESKPNPIADLFRSAVDSPIALVRSIDPVDAEENAVIQIERNLKVGAERDSTVIVLSYDAKTPELAQIVLAALTEVYLEEHMRIHRNEKSRGFFDEQRELLRQRLDDATAQLRDAKIMMGLASTEGRAASLEQQLLENRLEQDRTSQALATAHAHMQEVEAQLAGTPERMVSSKKQMPNEGADLLRDQLYALQVRKIDLEARYSDSHPLLQSINEQVKQAEKIIGAESERREETIDDVNPIHRQMTLEYQQQQASAAGLEARAAKLAQQRVVLLDDMKELNANEVRLVELNRDVQLANSNFFQYAENQEEARIDKALENEQISNVSPLQDATLARKPVSPSKLLILVATLMMSTAAPVALALGIEKSDDRLKRDVEVEDLLELPVLASIPNSALHSRLLPTTGVVDAAD